MKDCKTMSFDRGCGDFHLAGIEGEPMRLYHKVSAYPIAEAATTEEMIAKIEALCDDLTAIRYDIRFGGDKLYGMYLPKEPDETEEAEA